MSLQQALERLRAPHPAVQAAAVAAVFELAARAQSAAQRDAALSECLSHSSQAVVEAAVQALLALPTQPAAAHASSQQDLLLTALSVAGPATAATLAGGILQLYERQLSSQPPALAAAQPLLPGFAHSALARVACCSPSTAAQLELLQLLVAHLPALRLTARDPGGAQQAAAAVANVMDVLESCADEPGVDIVASLAAHLVCLCHEAASAEAPALLQQLLAALSLLAGYWPGEVAAHAGSLGSLLLQHPGTQLLGAAEAKAALALLATLLQHLAAEECRPAIDSQQLAALLLLPLLQQAALGGSRECKQWAGHALLLLRSLSTAASSPSMHAGKAAQHSYLHGTSAGVRAAEQLLARLWQHPLEAQHWLASLQLSLATSPGGSGEGSRPGKDQQQMDRGTLLVACALLQQPAEAVQRAALRSLVAAMAATPLLGLSLLPLLVHEMQRQVERFLSGKVQRPQRQLLELLHALAEAGHHPAALPFVLRTLQPLLSAGTPEVLQAAGLRLLCRLWHTSGGRAYQQLRGAVIGYAAPGQSPGLALRVARAECLRDICSSDPDKAVELVGLVQECLADESPAVAALGLDCVAMLCEADVLEFYAAWRVVHRELPRLPEHPAAAAAWVRLLGGGGLDAAVQPDAAAAIVDALWLAATHEAAQVRCQAYASLAAFSFEKMEGIEALRPLAGGLLAAVLQQGFAPTEQQSAAAVVQQLLSVPAGAARLPQAAAAKRGATAGVAALLQSEAVDPGSQQFKAAVAALEGLAISDSDPRVCRACALPLATLCHAVRRAGGLGGGAAAPSDAQGAQKSLAQLPSDGALRPLLESLLESRWVLPNDDEAEMQPQHELSAAEAAALLRCIAAAERLPALNYGTLCRRLLRSHSGNAELFAAAAAFAAAQGSRQQQQYHLADFAAELLSQGSQEAAPSWQLQPVLAHLPRLLAALPEAQAQ
ncbi:RST1 isoform X1 [Chlorella sorokiniana]|uniref:RST1 isoform X1 n=1 Tax=Chlorella sorokiniana TaxID=3076 RepID=A0A2P6TB28_CHLSO|nr:RST1 isoform X1 [Chlorella sorokiniana]|eukprot:PRW05754.1 RST1 isoform X1 [Chlorella sorokiniana]